MPKTRRRVPSLVAVASLAAATLVGVAPAQAAGIWQPHVDPTFKWQWQITGTVDTNVTPAAMYDIDEQDAVPTTQTVTSGLGLGKSTWSKGPNATAIATLHGKNKIVICYLDSGAWESYRPDASLFPASVKGNSTGWSGERWLDIRSPAWPNFAPLIWARMDLAKKIGCDGIEPDQNNPIGNNPGFPITLADQKAWYLEVARQAHIRGLSVTVESIETGAQLIRLRRLGCDTGQGWLFAPAVHPEDIPGLVHAPSWSMDPSPPH